MRPSRDEWLLALAAVTSTRSTCARRRVGCVLADERGRVLSTGYNGPPHKFKHCTVDDPCDGANRPSGTSLDLCQAVHAEQNALLQCRDVDRVDTCYVTTSPCVTCVKLLLNTPCQRIVFAGAYATETGLMAASLWLMLPNPRVWLQLDVPGRVFGDGAWVAGVRTLEELVKP